VKAQDERLSKYIDEINEKNKKIRELQLEVNKIQVD